MVRKKIRKNLCVRRGITDLLSYLVSEHDQTVKLRGPQWRSPTSLGPNEQSNPHFPRSIPNSGHISESLGLK
jgi:hypothetical protein